MTMQSTRGGMANCEIRRAARRIKNFAGVFPANHNPLSLIKTFPCSFIINSRSISPHSGHWLAFYLISPSSLEFFDSLAQPLAHYPIIASYFSNFITRLSNTRVVLQSSESSLCGEYCIAFLHLRSNRHLRFSSIISLLFKKTHSRESFVSRYRLLLNK